MAQRAHKKQRVQALHARIPNVRKDWTHQATTAIARRAKRMVIGDVSSPTLVKTPCATSTYEAAWGIVRHQLPYKAKRLAGVSVDGHARFSRVTCADCGARSGPRGLRGLGVSTWVCTGGGVAHEREVNAARNILAFRSGRTTPRKGIPGLEGGEDVNSCCRFPWCSPWRTRCNSCRASRRASGDGSCPR